MRSNKIMKRQMGDYEVLQRTSDSYFDGNALLLQWKHEHPKCKDSIKDFLDQKKVKDFIQYLQDDLRSQAQPQKGGMDEIQIIKYDKGNNSSNGRLADKVWMHPYLFIDFAMWLNPKFKLSVIKFIYDQLIQQRTLAGDNYKTLSSSIVKLKGYSFQEVAKAIQWIVYNKTGKDLRQTATQEQLQEINEIQTKLAFAIDMNYITSYSQLLEEMRKIYNKKYQKF